MQFLLKHTLAFINLSYSKADFLKKANLLQICVFKGNVQFYTKDVKI
jgi:hypothetical protein